MTFRRDIDSHYSTLIKSFAMASRVRACSLVYDELESGCRQLAAKCVAKGLWTPPARFKVETSPWARLMTEFDDGLDRTSSLGKRKSRKL